MGLVKQLLEYKRLKDQATLLDRHKLEHEARFPRVPVLPEIDTNEPPPLDMDEVQIWDLLDAFSRLMRDIGGSLKKSRFHEVAYDDTPIELHEADIEDRVRREKKVSLRALVEGRQSRSEIIGVFLALLELIRQKKILIHQNPDDLLEMEIEDAPEEHRRTFLGTSAEQHLARFESPPPSTEEDAPEEAPS